MKKAILMGILGGIGVFIFGFTIMYLLWEMIGSPNRLPGLFYYRAATIGDALCLPVLTGSAVAFNQYNKEWLVRGRHKKISFVIALIASVTATLIQASWLIRGDTVLNWSIPIQHHFNVAGWYHSLFFIAMFGIIAYQMCEMWFSIRRKRKEYSWFERVLYVLFSFAGTLFILMFVSDDYSQYLSPVFLLTIVAVGVFLMLALYTMTADKEHGDELLSTALTGIIAAFSFSLIMCVPTQGDWAIALGGALCACFLWRVESFAVGQLIYEDFWTIVFYTLALYVISGMRNIAEMSCALLFLIIATVLSEKLYIKEIRFRSLSLMAIGVYILLGNEIFSRLTVLDEVVDLLFSVTIYFLFKKEITSYFNLLIEAEEAYNKNQIDKNQFKWIKVKVYLQIVLGILAAVILIARWLLDIARSRGSMIEKGFMEIPEWAIGILIISIGVLAILGINKYRKYKIAKLAAVMISILIFMVLIDIVVRNIGEFPVLTWTPLKWIMLCCSFCACIGSAILSGHGYYMNTVLLRGVSKKILALFLAAIQLTGGLVLNSCITIMILCHQTWDALLLVVAISAIAFVLLPVLHAQIIRYEQKEYHVVGNNPLGGVAQDGLMICLIVFFAACMPCVYISLINVVDTVTIVGGCSLIGSAFLPVGFCIKNNVGHIERQKEVLGEYPGEKELWNTLHICLVRQSKQTVFAMFPYVCIVVASLFFKGLLQNKTLGEVIRELINKYIDKDEY